MNDLFADVWSSLNLSEQSLKTWIEFRNNQPASEYGMFTVRRHLDFILLSLRGRHSSWEAAWVWTNRIKETLGPLLTDKERVELEAASKAFRDRTDSIDGYRGKCVVCGEEIDGRHKCDKPQRDRQERSGASRGQTESDRIAEGFKIIQEMEEA